MKTMKRLSAIVMALLLIFACALPASAALDTGHKISVKLYKVVLDSSKPLGYQNPELVDTITVTCTDSTGHSGYNHNVPLKVFHPKNVGLSTTDWTGWQFDMYYTKGKDRATFYDWTRENVNATANVAGSEPYPCSKNFYYVYKDVASTPTATPTPKPTATPTPTPTAVPATATPEPTEVPATATPEPTEVPATAIPEPTEVPATEVPATEVPATEVPATEVPATEVPPTEVPSTEVPPTVVPTVKPTDVPTAAPTEEPTAAPTEEPTAAPTEEPTVAPTEEPTAAPTEEPTVAPTEEPTVAPTAEPTATPTAAPTVAPTKKPGNTDIPKTSDRTYPVQMALLLGGAFCLLIAAGTGIKSRKLRKNK